MIFIVFMILVSGDVIADKISVLFSGEAKTWHGCADPDEPGEWAEVEVYHLETDFVLSSGVVPIANGIFTYSSSINVVGMIAARARACNDEGCSDWLESFDSPGDNPSCVGHSYIYSILAPPGAPEI